MGINDNKPVGNSSDENMSDKVKEKATQAQEKISTSVASAKKQANETAADAQVKVSETVKSVKEQADQAANQTQEKVSAGVESAKKQLNESVENTKENVSSLRERASEAVETTKANANKFVEKVKETARNITGAQENQDVTPKKPVEIQPTAAGVKDESSIDRATKNNSRAGAGSKNTDNLPMDDKNEEKVREFQASGHKDEETLEASKEEVCTLQEPAVDDNDKGKKEKVNPAQASARHDLRTINPKSKEEVCTLQEDPLKSKTTAEEFFKSKSESAELRKQAQDESIRSNL